MKSDQIKWNKRYKNNMGNLSPSWLVEKYSSFARVGTALDIACGNGRNSLFLAEKGFRVDALDISDVAIRNVKQMHPDIHAKCRDLDHFDIPPGRYDLIANIKYLNRYLLPTIPTGLKPGGILIFQSFTGDAQDSYCLADNELRQMFSGLKTLFYEEKDIDPPGRFAGTACLVAIKN